MVRGFPDPVRPVSSRHRQFRAKQALASTGILITPEEADGVRAVRSAAALTYVAATVTAIAQLLYFLLRLGMLGGSDE